MRKILSRTLLVVLLLAMIAYVLLATNWGRELVLRFTLPAFPSWPEPQLALDAEDSGEIYYSSSSPYEFDVILAGHAERQPTTALGYLTFPDNVSDKSPVPAVVLLHGSGGISAGREHDYARLLNDNGIAAFVVDYYKPRGVTKDTNYIMKVSAATEFDVIVDAYAALKLLSTHPLIDAEKIGVMGFSYGGMAARFAMDDRFRNVLAADYGGFALHVDVYGPCFQNLKTQQTNGAPLLTLRGTEDRSNDLQACAVRENQLRALGVEVESHIYEGAGHAWEAEIPRFLAEDSPYIVGCEVEYDQQGRSYLNGEPHTHSALDASRISRVAARLASGPAFQSCLQYGYLIGSDPDTKAKANTVLLNFLARHFN